MSVSRRRFLGTGASAIGGVTILPFIARAGGHLPNEIKTAGGLVVVHPVAHASVVLETPAGVIYVDPVGEPSSYEGLPPAELVLVTHEHGDHLNADTLAAVTGAAPIITNPAVLGKLSGDLAARARAIANGESTDHGNAMIEAIPAYNITEGRLNFHPQGRDNGYVINIGDGRVYVSGDTEDTPEMRALTGIDLAFVSMNLPFTMDIIQAASALAEFKPAYVYPYHYRGREGGTQDLSQLAALGGDATTVKLHNWYGEF